MSEKFLRSVAPNRFEIMGNVFKDDSLYQIVPNGSCKKLTVASNLAYALPCLQVTLIVRYLLYDLRGFVHARSKGRKPEIES